MFRARALWRVWLVSDPGDSIGLPMRPERTGRAALQLIPCLGAEMVRVFVDAGTSGRLGIEHRPVLLDAVGTLKRGDVLLVAKRDRLGRDVIAVAND